jgi:OOP family OmpA-OmpF porin
MKRSKISNLTLLLRASVMAMIPALLAFNVIAKNVTDNHTGNTNHTSNTGNTNNAMQISTAPDAVSAASHAIVPSAVAATKPVILAHTGTQYVPVAKVTDQLAQVVFYHPNNGDSGVANVYVDREFQSALKNGEFTVFCVPAGTHIIESYLNDDPRYEGKQKPTSVAQLNGGDTYFLETNRAAGVGTPVTASRTQAENQLFGYKASTIINRASAVRACEYLDGSTLGNILFRFAGKNKADIEEGGVAIVQNMANQLNMVNQLGNQPQISRVNIVGHADPVGTAAFNQKLSVQRAQTVKKILASYGIASERLFTIGMGASNPTVDCSGLKGTERNFCNRANRRVDILIQNN